MEGAAPTHIAQYRLLQKLGEGGMGVVYLAEDTRLGRRVALKLLPVGPRDEHERARFLTEARAASALDHPYICTVFEFGEHDGLPFLAMQLVDGESLRAVIDRGPLPEDRVREIVVGVASALGAAHGRGIVHRDVKSDNILLGNDGAIKLADFGIARLAEADRLTTATKVLGTPAYMAPEQVLGQGTTAASDQFALAVVAYEGLTGVLPFPSADPMAAMYAIANTPAEPPSSRRASLHTDWDPVLLRALAKDPAERYASMEQFARAISACGHDDAAATGGTAARPRSVAVMYFEDRSADRDGDYFCAGVTEDIITGLAGVPGLRVASWNAVERYRGQAIDVRRVAADLHVDLVLLGTVRRAGNRVRITAELVQGNDGFQRWAERYDRTLEDIFAVQEDIARAIVAALSLTLTPQQAAELQRSKPAEVAAYDLYLRGRALYRRYTPEDMVRAHDTFQEAVEVEPSYALAWAGIADCCGQMIDRGWQTDRQWFDRGVEAARRAIEIDDRLAEGHKAAALLWRTTRDHARTLAELQKALQANPSFIPALINLAVEKLCSGDLAGAERVLRRATRVDPAYGLGHLMLALALLYTRRPAAAIESCHRAQNEGASPFYVTFAYPMRAQAFVEQGNFEAARLEMAGGRAARVPQSMLDATEALIAARSSQPDLALRILARLEARHPTESYGCELAAAAAGSLGQAALAAAFLRAAEAIDARHPVAWRLSLHLRPILTTPEFESLLGDRGRALVWPAEAPPLAAEERARFSEYSEASGLEETSESATTGG